jgi:hypothetical protein
MADEWQPAETTTHQEHVIAHVLGATALGHFTADETACFILDIGFIWTILLDGAMGLVPYKMALAELNVSDEERMCLSADADALYEAGADAALTRVAHDSDAGPLVAVEFYERAEGRRLLLMGESATISITTDFATGAIEISAQPQGATT